MQGKDRKYAMGIGLVVVMVFGVMMWNPAAATHQPADKLALNGGALETVRTSSLTPDIETILSGVIKTSAPSDLVFQVTAECSLLTDITSTKNSGYSTALASVKVWVELDGKVIPVSPDETVDIGKVVFCEREFGMKIESDMNESILINTYLRTRSANAFNWMTTNVGSGVHTIEVKASVEKYVTGTGTALGALGKRTLVVEPVKLGSDVSL